MYASTLSTKIKMKPEGLLHMVRIFFSVFEIECPSIISGSAICANYFPDGLPQTLFFQLACSFFGQERRFFWNLTLEFLVHTCVPTF